MMPGASRPSSSKPSRRFPASPNSSAPGDSLTAKATVEAVREEDGEHFVDLAVSTVNQDGTVVVKGQASARVDA